MFLRVCRRRPTIRLHEYLITFPYPKASFSPPPPPPFFSHRPRSAATASPADEDRSVPPITTLGRVPCLRRPVKSRDPSLSLASIVVFVVVEGRAGWWAGWWAGGRRRRGRRQRLQAFSTYNGRDRIPLSRDGGLQRLRQVTRLAWDKEAGGKAQGGGKRKAGGMRERRGRKAKRNETKYKKKYQGYLCTFSSIWRRKTWRRFYLIIYKLLRTKVEYDRYYEKRKM